MLNFTIHFLEGLFLLLTGYLCMPEAGAYDATMGVYSMSPPRL